MPRCQKIMPPLQIQPKFRAEVNRMIMSAEAAEEVQHMPQKKCNLARLWQDGEDGQSGTQVGICYNTNWSASIGSTLVKPSVSRLGDGRSDPVSPAQFLRLPNKWMGQCICWVEGVGQVNDRRPAKSKFCEHCRESVGPAVIKSSR